MYAILLNYNPNLKAAYDMMFTKDFGNRLDKIKQSPYFNELSQHYPVFKSLYLNIHNREVEFETDTQTSPTDRRDKIYNIYLIKSPNITSLEEDSIIFQFENLNKIILKSVFINFATSLTQLLYKIFKNYYTKSI